MSQFNVGDKVQYLGQEYTVTGWNDILDEHELQSVADETDTMTVSEDLLLAEIASVTQRAASDLSKAAKYGATYTKGAKVGKITNPNVSLGGKHGIRPKGAHNNSVSTGSDEVKQDHHNHTADDASKVKRFASALSGKGALGTIRKAKSEEAAKKEQAAQEAEHLKAQQNKMHKFAMRTNPIRARRGLNSEFEQDQEKVIPEQSGSEELPQDNEQLVEDQKLLDETAASDTIKAKPSAASGVMSSSMVKDVIQAVSGMSKGDQVDFYNKMMTQYGKGKSHGAPEKAGENKSSINAKPSHAKSFKVDSTSQLPSVQIVKDDLQHILDSEESETFSEEFKLKIATLFEAAVNLRVAEEVSMVREELEEKLETEIEESVEALTEHVDTYLTRVASEWADENQVEIENSLQMQLSNSFMEGLKNLFSEHYMNVPEESVDIVSALAERVEELEEGLNEQLKENVELVETLQEYNAEEIFDELCEGLALTQIEKFRTLSEGLDYEGNEEEYRAKLAVIREQYFSTKSAPQTTLNEEVDVDYEEELDEETVIDMDQDPNVLRYAETISRTLKR